MFVKQDSETLLVSYLDKRLILWAVHLGQGDSPKTDYGKSSARPSLSFRGQSPKQVYLGQALKILEAPDLVTCLQCHPMRPSSFALGGLDKYIRILDVEEDCITDWFQSEDYITALEYSPDGGLLVVGFYRGVCRVYRVEPFLIYQCDVFCRNSNINELNPNRVINIKFLNQQEFIVSTTDSRIRLFHTLDLRKHRLKYKGHTNIQHMLRSDSNNRLVISPSQEGEIFVWSKDKGNKGEKGAKEGIGRGLFGKEKKERNAKWESFFPGGPRRDLSLPAGPADRCRIALFAPPPLVRAYRERVYREKGRRVGELIISVSEEGSLQVLADIEGEEGGDMADRQDERDII